MFLILSQNMFVLISFLFELWVDRLASGGRIQGISKSVPKLPGIFTMLSNEIPIK